MQFRNVHFWPCKYISNVKEMLEDFIVAYRSTLLNTPRLNRRNSNKTVVIFGFCSWDVQLQSLSAYFKNFNILKKTVTRMATLPNIRWIYMTRPAAWDNSSCFCSRISYYTNVINLYHEGLGAAVPGVRLLRYDGTQEQWGGGRLSLSGPLPSRVVRDICYWCSFNSVVSRVRDRQE